MANVMGKSKSKTARVLSPAEDATVMAERQANVNKLLRRMNSQGEENDDKMKTKKSDEIDRDDGDDSSLMNCFRKPDNGCRSSKKRKKSLQFTQEVVEKETKARINAEKSQMMSLLQNHYKLLGNDNDDVVLEKSCSAPEGTSTSVDTDSIDYIIDQIVDKSNKRDEELVDVDAKPRRSTSFHGSERRKKRNFLNWKSLSKKYKDCDDLTRCYDDEGDARLRNLESRASAFEKHGLVCSIADKNDKKTDDVFIRRKTNFNNNNNVDKKKEMVEVEIENIMLRALHDVNTSEHEDEDWRTIERITASNKERPRSPFIVSPKADPIIMNVVNKLMCDENNSDNKNDIMKSVGARKTNSATIVKGKTYCQNCKKKCSGEVLRVQDKYFHISCFKCKACKNSLAQGGFFCKDGAYYCTADYQRQYGTKCAQCKEYVEGEVVTALGNTYHQKCFTCARCRQAFPSGERVTYTGKEVLCQKCVHIPVRDTRSPTVVTPTGPNECAGCREELKDGQALIALERQWHIWCFKCKTCEAVLHGEYMGKDGVPYCEKDYQKQFGVKCAYCSRYISGKVLQAGDNHHFHPTCARCTKCGDPFGDGEEMYLQGGAIWHPRCGPGPTENGTILNGSAVLENGHCTDTDGEMSGRDGRDLDRMSSSAVSEMQFSMRSRTPSFSGSLGSPYNSLNRKYSSSGYPRTGSPGLILREYKSNQQFAEDISRIYTYSYLTEEPTHGYLRRPIDPYDKPPTSPHFHRPSSSHSHRSNKVLVKTGSKSGMKVMAESIRSETPRPKSPHMNNEEPIELSHYPDAKRPKPGDKPKIERDDFPAPPYPYTDPERRKRWSDTYKGVSDDEEDVLDSKKAEDDKLKKEEEELSKIATGIGKVFLQNVKEREKLRQWKLQHLDPRNASRVPSANKESALRLRYQSPVNASPSRNMDHPRPWEEDELIDRSSSYRSSVGRSVGAIPSYNVSSSRMSNYTRPTGGKSSTLPATATGRYTSGYSSDYGVGYNTEDALIQSTVVSALRHVPKPGYGLAPRSHTFSSTGGSVSNIGGDFSFSGFGDKTHSTEFSSGKSDSGSISEVDRKVLNAEMPVSTTFQGGLRYTSSYSPHLRRSLPTLSHMSTEPPKIYPYHLLLITNYRLPADVDRCNLERHLSDSEFEQLFRCSRTEFYRLPQWRRNELKRKIRLF